MNAKNLMRLLLLIPLLILLIGCGRKGPPTLPKEPTSLTKIKQKKIIGYKIKVPKVLKVIYCEFRNGRITGEM